MMLLGRVRKSLVDVELPTDKLYSMKLACMKERLWGSARELTLGLLTVDAELVPLPRDSGAITATVTIQYCGG